MERRLLNLYLKHIKEVDKKVFRKVTMLPKRIVVQLIIIMFMLVVSVLSAFLSGKEFELVSDQSMWKTICSWIYLVSLMLSVVICIISHFSISKYEIAVSDISIKDYWRYCERTKGWIKTELLSACNDECVITEEIHSLKERIDQYRCEVDALTERREIRTEKWIQTLAIPVVLAIITAAINKSEKWETALSVIVAIIAIGAMAFSVIWLINNFKSLLRKQKSEQLKFFSEDLQGVLDWQHYSQYIKSNK